jgi:CDP-diacylglycerol--glycerol-3-phosphate 3-phosphatidyltransferase
LFKFLYDFFHKATLPIGRGLARMGLTPNHVSLIGFALMMGSAGLIATGRPLAGGIGLWVAGIFDILDGSVARATGLKTKAGAFLDSTLDRLSDGLIFGALAWYAASNELLLILGCLIFAFMTSYIRARAEGLGFECRVGFIERPERVVIVGIGLVFGVLYWALGLLLVLSLLTVVQRFVHVWKQARERPAL